MAFNTLVTLGGYGDDAGVTRTDFLDVADHFLVDVRGGGYGDQRGVGVEEGDGAVFEFAGGEAFGVDVGDFFEFECTFESGGIADATPDEYHAAAMRHALRQGGDDVVGGAGFVQYLCNLVGDAFQSGKEFLGLQRSEFATV